MNHFPGQPFMPVSPMLSPVHSYGSMYGNMMSSSPQHPAYFNYPWMQSGALSPNNSNNNQPLPGHSRLPHTNMTATPVTSTYFPPVSMPTSISHMSSATAYPLRTSPQQMMTSQQRQYQYPHFLYGSQGYHGGQ
ncbi:hypothetical protein DPMN_121384 [Dreissena polymorpha]|uniref:Uncharacterized protein n=2 Tax=Dreissena polymorpha TaxID=45954 RepID=A0A9D4GQE5_DREPO|nr:hypothetical protein DPMN_121384 [Dreissena polymorpha]